MYSVTTEGSFDAAHFLKDYQGKCKNIHGHRWRVIIEVSAASLLEDKQNQGMVADFKDVKEILNKLLDTFDHTLIYEKDSIKPELKNLLLEEDFSLREVPFRPTAENFSRFFFEELGKNMNITKVSVYETPNNCATYTQSKE